MALAGTATPMGPVAVAGAMPGPPVPADLDAIDPVAEPAAYRATVTLEDGGRVHVRPIRPEDKQALLEGFRNLSRDSVYKRFFGPKKTLTDKELVYLTELDFHSHVALVAIVPDDPVADQATETRKAAKATAATGASHTGLPEGVDHPDEVGTPVGVGRYVLLDQEGPPTAELAITVTDAHQHRGIGGVLFDRLCAMAREQGIEAFVGTMLPENTAMRRLLEEHGDIVEETWARDGVRMTVRLEDCGAGRADGLGELG